MRKSSVPQPHRPYRALCAAADGGPAGGGALLRWLFSQRFGSRLASTDREDVLQGVGLVLLERAARIRHTVEARTQAQSATGSEADQVVASYVARMVNNRAVDLQRARRGSPLPPDRPVHPSPEVRLDLARTLQLVQRAWKLAGTGRLAVAAGLDELDQLARNKITMRVLVHRARRSPSEPHDRIRDRIYVRHRRARRALKDTLRELADAERVGDATLTTALTWVDCNLCRRWASTSEVA